MFSQFTKFIRIFDVFSDSRYRNSKYEKSEKLNSVVQACEFLNTKISRSVFFSSVEERCQVSLAGLVELIELNVAAEPCYVFCLHCEGKSSYKNIDKLKIH